jgi:hypothetical protein
VHASHNTQSTCSHEATDYSQFDMRSKSLENGGEISGKVVRLRHPAGAYNLEPNKAGVLV